MTSVLWDAMQGWVGIDQYDEDNPVAHEFLDRFEARTGRRADYFLPLVNHDIANLIVHALADARPLSPRGVRDALERIKMLPAASGSPGTRLGFGNYQHRAWIGSGYLVARAAEPEFGASHRVARFAPD